MDQLIELLVNLGTLTIETFKSNFGTPDIISASDLADITIENIKVSEIDDHLTYGVQQK